MCSIRKYQTNHHVGVTLKVVKFDPYMITLKGFGIGIHLLLF